MVNDPIVGVLVNANYIATGNHTSLADIVPATRVATTGTLVNRTVTKGVFNSNSLVVFSLTGDEVAAVVLVKSTGTDITSPLIAYLDQSPDLPFNPNGNSVVINWDTGSYKVFSI